MSNTWKPPSSGSPGGGSLPFTLLGPYTVSHTQLDPVSAFDLGLLADGTIVWSVAIFVRELFTTNLEHVGVQLGTADGMVSVFLHDVAATGQQAPSVDIAVIEGQILATSHWAIETGFVGLAQDGAHLTVYDSQGGNTAGSVDIYALVSVPT